jgi:hypothetical protein
MRAAFNAISSRLTPAGVQDPALSAVVESMHENVTTEGVTEEHKSDGSPNDSGIRFSREFNEVARRSPGFQRLPRTEDLNEKMFR